VSGRRPEMTDQVFNLMAELVRRRAGIVVGEAHRPRLESRLAAEARSAGSYYELYARFRDDGPGGSAFARLLDASVNGETYFFRDPSGLKAFASEIVPERRLAVGPEGTIDVWSAGCSTGEEAYTLAMVLAEKGSALLRGVRIVGTDASAALILRARQGVYGVHALRETLPARQADHFDALADGKFRVKERIRAQVEFEARPFGLEPADGPLHDVIVCRNVLMYLEPAARDAAVSVFTSRLKPGGYLLLGPSDMLAAAVTPLTLVRLANDVAYRK